MTPSRRGDDLAPGPARAGARPGFVPILILGLALALAASARAQDLEPRRWSHLPRGMNVFGLAVGRTEGDLIFDPVLLVRDAEVTADTRVASFVHSFGLFERSARVDVLVPHASSKWEGLLDGQPASTQRTGFADPRVRLSVNLVGAPSLAGPEFMEFRNENPTNTIVGAAVSITLPWGEYKEDKLLNLGGNRYVFRPQVGVLHIRGPWSYELTASTFFFTTNDDFFNGNKLQQDPLHAVQAHVVRSFPGGWWASAGAAYGWGGESKLNGERQSDRRGDLLSGFSVGCPVGQNQSVKVGYIRSRTQIDVGADTDSVAGAWSIRF